jgi:hypothetical protein
MPLYLDSVSELLSGEARCSSDLMQVVCEDIKSIKSVVAQIGDTRLAKPCGTGFRIRYRECGSRLAMSVVVRLEEERRFGSCPKPRAMH